MVLHNNSSYTQIVETLRKSLREKAGEPVDSNSNSHEPASKLSPSSPDNEDSQEDPHGTKRKRGKSGNFNNFVFDEQPPQKVVSLDPLSEISLSMAILARSSLDRNSEQQEMSKVDCKNNVHQYVVSPNNSFIFCRACGNVIKL